MLSIQDLNLSLMGDAVVKNLDLTVEPGQVICLYGPSGCGKTTVLRIIADLVKADSGQINNQFANTTYLFQEHRLLPWYSARENIELVLQHLDQAQRKQQASAILSRLYLSVSDGNKYPDELSGGMRQRVALARALVMQPDLLLMDEPFSALDFELRRELQQLIIQQVEQGMSVILVTHDRYEALKMADIIYLLENKPAHCRQSIRLDTPYSKRNHDFIETYLNQDFWRAYLE